MDVTQVEQVAQKERTSFWSEAFSWLRFCVGLAVLCYSINHVVGFGLVNGNSMSPTLRHGSVLLLNKLSVYTGQPECGDVVVIGEPGRDIIKRVIGLPGDKVAIKDGSVLVNGQPLPEVYALGQSEDMAEVLVPENEFFFLGDNRPPGESLDSRSDELGTEPIERIKGYTVVSLYPFYKIMKPLELP